MQRWGVTWRHLCSSVQVASMSCVAKNLIRLCLHVHASVCIRSNALESGVCFAALTSFVLAMTFCTSKIASQSSVNAFPRYPSTSALGRLSPLMPNCPPTVLGGHNERRGPECKQGRPEYGAKKKQSLFLVMHLLNDDNAAGRATY